MKKLLGIICMLALGAACGKPQDGVASAAQEVAPAQSTSQDSADVLKREEQRLAKQMADEERGHPEDVDYVLTVREPDTMRISWPAYGADERKEELLAVVQTGDLNDIKNMLGRLQQDDDISEALAVAAGQGSLEIVKLLLEYQKEKDGTIYVYYVPALLNAAASGHVKIVRLLVNVFKCSPYDHYYKEALLTAIMNGRQKVIRFLLKPENPHLNPSDCPGAPDPVPPTPEQLLGEILFDQMHGEKADMAKAQALLSYGADVNWKYEIGAVGDCACNPPSSVLIEAVQHQDLLFVKWLVEEGADVNLVVTVNCGDDAPDVRATALSAAKTRGDVPIIQFLKLAGAKETADTEG